MAICKKCSKPYFHETNYENLCCKCYEKQNEKVYHCYPELTIIKIIVYAYDKYNIDEIKRFNKYGQIKENNISKAIRESITILGHETILELIDKIDNKKDFIKELNNVSRETNKKERFK